MEGGCGVIGIASSEKIAGRHLLQALNQMRNRGNGKGGHVYGTDLTAEEKDALLVACEELARQRSRSAAHAGELKRWTDPLFGPGGLDETEEEERLTRRRRDPGRAGCCPARSR